jgi:predicted Zn-dependent protease
MQDRFFALADRIGPQLRGREGFLARYAGEVSQFVRFNRAAVRQPGTVEQHYLTLELFEGRRHAATTITLTADDAAEDAARVSAAVSDLRDALADTPEDPHFVISDAVHSTTRSEADALPTPQDALNAILTAAKGEDLVGFYAAGPVARGFANSYGQRNWAQVYPFSFDACFYLSGDPSIRDRAVKMDYGGTTWDAAAFDAKAAEARSRLAALARPAKTIAPGAYRVYLSPAAMEELMTMLCWGGFSLEGHQTGTTPLIRMRDGAQLSPQVTLTENIAGGFAPAFQSEGFVKPAAVPLIAAGVYRESLAAPRSAAEFGVPHNAAEGFESPVALDMHPGTLPDADILKTLGTGIYIGNLWYLNFSDRNACRLTGMTRFATFWVENGEIVAPLNVMRFDDTIYRLLGENLVALTQSRDMRLSNDTYEARSTRSMHLPGAVIDDLRFTL